MCVSAGGIHSFDWLRRGGQIHFFVFFFFLFLCICILKPALIQFQHRPVENLETRTYSFLKTSPRAPAAWALR